MLSAAMECPDTDTVCTCLQASGAVTVVTVRSGNLHALMQLLTGELSASLLPVTPVTGQGALVVALESAGVGLETGTERVGLEIGQGVRSALCQKQTR